MIKSWRRMKITARPRAFRKTEMNDNIGHDEC